MSRQELAEAVNRYLWETHRQAEHLDENDIGKLERGEHRWPRDRRREAFRAVLHAGSDAELGFYINRRSAARTEDLSFEPVELAADDAVIVKIVVEGREHSIRLSRRELLEAVGGGMIAPLLDDPHPLVGTSAISPAIVQHFGALRALLVDSDNRLGAVSVLSTVRHQLGVIAQFRRQARGDLHAQLLSTQARWAEFAGWLSDDLGDHSSGAWWLGQALTMAQEANDLDFCAYLFARMAQREAGGADEDRVLGLAQAATRAGTAHRHILAFAILQRGYGHAVAGEVSMFQAAVEQAQTLVDGRVVPGGELGSFCSTPYVMAHEGEGWLRLGYPQKAAECLGRALAVWPTRYQRERGLYLSRAAAAQFASEQPDEAATTALKALELAEATGSARVKREVALLGQRLAPFRNQSAPAALLDALAVSTGSAS